LRSKPNRILKVDPAFVDLFEVEFHRKRRSTELTFKIRDPKQGGVLIQFPEAHTAERFCDRITGACAREFRPIARQSFVSMILEWWRGLFGYS